MPMHGTEVTATRFLGGGHNGGRSYPDPSR